MIKGYARTLAGFVAVGWLWLPLAPGAYAEEAGPYADLVLRGGKVVTLDPSLAEQQAIAVSGAWIEHLGSDAELEAYIGEGTRVIDLGGRLVVPGFIEGHGHFMDLGRSKQVLDLGAAANWQDILVLVAEAVNKTPSGEWIYGRGWHQEKWDSLPADAVEGVPRNTGLNLAAPGNPVYLTHASGHAAMANQAALDAAGVSDETPDPSGGTLVRGPDGRLTGLLRETAQDLVQSAANAQASGRPQEEWELLMRERVRLAGEEALAHGITSFHDAGTTFAVIDLLERLEAEGALPVRLYVMVMEDNLESLEEMLPRYFMPSQGDDYLAVRSIKRQIDGALGSHGAWLLEPYEDLPDTSGLALEPLESFERAVELAANNGFQVNTHAIGTRANREVLDAYERVWKRYDLAGGGLRWRIEHAQHIHPQDVPRFGQLGVIAAVQGVHCTSDGPWIPRRLGDERARVTSYVWRDLLHSGALIGNGTDVPVEPINPIASFYASVTRRMADGRDFYPQQAMTRMEALRSYTIHNAYAAFEEGFKGSLTPGKLADLVVLSHDLLTVADEEILDTRVDYTVLGGKVVYERRP